MFNKERGRTEYPRKRIEKERKGLMYNGNLQVPRLFLGAAKMQRPGFLGTTCNVTLSRHRKKQSVIF